MVSHKDRRSTTKGWLSGLLPFLTVAFFSLPAVSSGQLGVDFPGNQLGCCDEIAQRAVAARFGLSGPVEAVDVFDWPLAM